MVKKNTEEQLYLINDFKNKKKLNNEKNFIKTKKNLSLIENKYVCQKNNNKSEKKINNFVDKKNHSIENNNKNIDNIKNIYNPLRTKIFDSSYTNYKNYNSYYKKSFININKRKIGNIDFDFIVENPNKKYIIKTKNIKNKFKNRLRNCKIKIIKNYELEKLYENKNNNNNSKNNKNLKPLNQNEKKWK